MSSSNLPVLSIFKSSKEVSSASDLFSEYKKIQAIQKQKALEQTRVRKATSRLQDLEDEISEKSEEITKILAKQAYLPALNVLDFIKTLHTSWEKTSMTFQEVERDFYKFVSSNSYKGSPDALLPLYAEVDESGHLIVCPDKDNCGVHRSHLGMGSIKVDVTGFHNEQQ